MIAKGRGISKGFVNSYLGIKRGGRTIAMTRRSEHRIPATRFHDSLSGKARSKRICLGISTVGARARGSFEDVVARRQRQPLRSLHRERERHRKKEKRKRETSSRLSRKGSNLESRIAGKCSKRVLVPGRGTRYRVAISCLPFYLNDPSHEKEGCSTTEIAARWWDTVYQIFFRGYFFSPLSFFLEYRFQIDRPWSRPLIRANYITFSLENRAKSAF